MEDFIERDGGGANECFELCTLIPSVKGFNASIREILKASAIEGTDHEGMTTVSMLCLVECS